VLRAYYTRGEALSDAQRTGILVASGRKNREELVEAWHERCTLERRPFVRIMLLRLFVVVELDMVPTMHTLSPEAQSALATIGRRFWSPHGPFRIQKQHVNIGGVNPDNAWTLAEQLLGIALQDMMRGA
jgi:hypothetical protein